MERQMRKLNLTHYMQGNKAGKSLARRLKTHYLQSKLPYMTSATNHKLYNPQDIVEELASYFDTLYNLHRANDTYQPSKDEILDFLSSVDLPLLTDAQKLSLQSPFTEEEVHKTVSSLPKPKIAIAHRWKQPQSPNLTEVLTRLDKTCNFERMASRLRSIHILGIGNAGFSLEANRANDQPYDPSGPWRNYTITLPYLTYTNPTLPTTL
ncbi:Hypothetical predicted protein [Pelobates cultripes]|uniref:Uncharacterized protein n=1 Tax=Pelobates cultripes TaxID=61616 RepID=A0AAD1R9N4_PELCU|nr:Hypothetical predicted protein [Pelobates cultripes]